MIFSHLRVYFHLQTSNLIFRLVRYITLSKCCSHTIHRDYLLSNIFRMFQNQGFVILNWIESNYHENIIYNNFGKFKIKGKEIQYVIFIKQRRHEIRIARDNQTCELSTRTFLIFTGCLK